MAGISIRRGVRLAPSTLRRQFASFKIPPPLKYREIIRLIEANGWFFERMGKGDHMIYRHPTLPGTSWSPAAES